MLRPRKVSEFASAAELRQYLIETITNYLRQIQSHVITDFHGETYDRFVAFARIGTGSLGGKGRGLAFMHKLLAGGALEIPNAEISIPRPSFSHRMSSRSSLTGTTCAAWPSKPTCWPTPRFWTSSGAVDSTL